MQRFEADSKFFRGLAVVLAAQGAVYLVRAGFAAFALPMEAPPALIYAAAGLLLAAAGCAAGIPLALWRYIDQRFKGTQQAYWFMIAFEGLRDPPKPAPVPVLHPDGVTHAGGVVFSGQGKNVTYLLVRASKHRDEWVLPKGHVEAGESLRETAVREVWEESSYWGRVIAPMRDVPFGTANVRFYLMQNAGQDEARNGKNRSEPGEDREPVWLPIAEAIKRAKFDDSKLLLAEADEARSRWLPGTKS